MSDRLDLDPLRKLRKYPHLEPLDTAIWNAWLDTDPWPDAVVAYDVHVGTVATVADGTPENYRRMVEHLSTLRIDVVVVRPGVTLVVEIKPSASLSAIGQALGYSLLFRDQYPDYPKPTPAILTDLSKPDTSWLCNRLNVQLFTLGRPITG
ncbi:unnamed protein product [marine sediment metagenome]|uniref:Uncharacterized protein n=1 Tax=marine sediment metagenome TaxID=412755 RepID=X1HPL6_9ZZZZ